MDIRVKKITARFVVRNTFSSLCQIASTRHLNWINLIGTENSTRPFLCQGPLFPEFGGQFVRFSYFGPWAVTSGSRTARNSAQNRRKMTRQVPFQQFLGKRSPHTLDQTFESASGVKCSHPRNGQGPERSRRGRVVRCPDLRKPLRLAFEVAPGNWQAITRDVSESSRWQPVLR